VKPLARKSVGARWSAVRVKDESRGTQKPRSINSKEEGTVLRRSAERKNLVYPYCNVTSPGGREGGRSITGRQDTSGGNLTSSTRGGAGYSGSPLPEGDNTSPEEEVSYKFLWGKKKTPTAEGKVGQFLKRETQTETEDSRYGKRGTEHLEDKTKNVLLVEENQVLKRGGFAS